MGIAWTEQELFRAYFLPLYPEDARADLARARTEDANPAGNPALTGHLPDAARRFVAAAETLFPEGVALDFTDASIHRLAQAMTRERISKWLDDGTAGSPSSVLFNAVVHGSAYVGECIVRNHGGRWSLRRPLWESVVDLRSALGEGQLAVFHWWLKALAEASGDDATDDRGGLSGRYRTYVENACFEGATLPVWLDASRRFPRLKKPRYDALYKYMKAHAPEVRDFGEDFPSPERFDELGFRWVEAVAVGGGRLLVLFGLGNHGAHLFWMDRGGFRKALFVPCDAFPEPVLKEAGDLLRLVVQAGGVPATHELLWWGP